MFHSIFNFIKTRGVQEHLSNENHITRLLNITSLISFVGAVGVFTLSLIYQNYFFTGLTLYISVFFTLIPILHHFTTIKTTRLFYALATPLWYCGAQLLVGGYFGQDIAAGGTALVVYLLFKDQPSLRNKLIFFNLFLFTLSSLYITFYQPLFGIIEFPFDELVVTFICIGWMSIVFFVYDTRLNKIIHTLKNKNKELTQKTVELKRFNYIASHDLKAPLGNIMNFAKLMKLEQQKDNSSKVSLFLNYIESNAHQMNDLIEDVLELSSIEYILNPTDVKLLDLNEVLKIVLASMKEEIDSKKGIITSNPLPSVMGNQHDFFSIFHKIIHNGLKFNNSAAPTIAIHATYHQEDFKLHFKDNGIGIPVQHQEQIFELFKKLHTQTEYVGSGLGLSISQKIMSKYNGTISVESTPDKSSTFTLTFPNSMLEENKLALSED